MTTETTTQPTKPLKRRKNALQKTLAFSINTIIALAIIAAGALITQYLFLTAPQADKKPRDPQPALIRTAVLNPIDYQVRIEAFGSAEAARTINLQPQISGIITTITPNLTPGGYLEHNQTLITIDPADYEITRAARQADLAKAQASLDIELGKQNLAKREYQLLGKSASEEDLKLILREPQLKTAQANLETAQSALDSAELDLQRTTLTAPFNAVVKEKLTDIGAVASPNSPIASLIGTDEFYIRLLVPTRDLSWIFQGNNATPNVTISNNFAWGERTRTAKIKHLTTELDSGARMAQILVSVNDPLSLKPQNENAPALLLGMYTRNIIDGPILSDVYTIPTAALHDNNTIWILTPENTLDIRTITPIWKDKQQTVTRTNIQPGEQLIVSQIITPVQDMKLKLTQ
ncbi:Multidrug resistance protein MdtA precursor [Poriferisphaera corsica]|uniref:Multidrug resistance protein MdtA n=1 Tax=Poriferisphaera corsica TaxID=2528020 RepID=A0A517YY02_9BACT|nr:efflux RND transporter periplasmic adaptor subunit [Poriferisphaera corsica]QDU35098.1 Multidrug resistance protein MdtA precursor [Poriferisphaera corsica]